ncbi:tyrosine-type recombinase/integrase [Brevibacillus sp. SAFN-007a]|uniref:tyrosine-type recombinase/integrase n=1 Tax=Brevibacillus sp. SAFN-007a TaxID=3436862 RepID=UPI003F7E7BAE
MEILKFCLEHQHNYAQTAKEFQVSYQQDYSWTNKYIKFGVAALQNKRGKRNTENEMSEMELLQAENKRKQMEIDFLKKLDEIQRGRSQTQSAMNRFILPFRNLYDRKSTGMKQGEILGLRWQDVDLKNRTLSIRQILNHDGKTLEPGAKTTSGVRSIGIDKTTALELDKLRRRTKEEKMTNRDIYEDNDLVICTQLGTPVSPRNINRSFYRLTAKAELKKIRFHDLRHTHVVMLLKMRENNKRIAERMGWSSVKMLDRYSHITPHMQKEAADAFGEMFFSAPNGTKKSLVE